MENLWNEICSWEWEYMLRLAVACLCGACVGFERSRRFKDAGVTGAVDIGKICYPVKNGGMAVAIGMRGRIICRGDAGHILVGSAAKLGKAVYFHWAGVGN